MADADGHCPVVEVDRIAIPQPDWTLLDWATRNPPSSWDALFREQLDNIAYIDGALADLKGSGKMVFPHLKNVFKAFYVTTPLDRVKVVIGQDPYQVSHRSSSRRLMRYLSYFLSMTSSL